MTCGINNVTPTMIRNGQMNIGDKIVFEDDIPVGAEITVSETATEVSAVSPEMTVEASSEVSAGIPLNTASGEAAEASAVTESSDAVETVAITQLSKDASDTPELQRWQNNPEAHTVQTPPPNWPNRPDPVQYAGENRNLITYPRMTDYFRDSVSINDTSSTPTFTVPINPMTPPEYTQTLDYDSVQYMNGFLRTQIGRFVRIEQLVGSNTIEDREGFLVGASNNYVLLQEIGTGNIMTFDLFSIKFVYIYYEDIPKPQPRS